LRAGLTSARGRTARTNADVPSPQCLAGQRDGKECALRAADHACLHPAPHITVKAQLLQPSFHRRLTAMGPTHEQLSDCASRSSSVGITGRAADRALDHSGASWSLSVKTRAPVSSNTAHLRAGSAIWFSPISTGHPAVSPKSSTTMPRLSASVPGYTRTRLSNARCASSFSSVISRACSIISTPGYVN